MAPLLELLEAMLTRPGPVSAFSISITVLWFLACLFTRWTTKKRWAYRDRLTNYCFHIAEDLQCLVDLASDSADVTRDDIRDELMRDRVAIELMVGDRTPENVQRYLYLEALRRARMRKLNLLGEDENDFFAAPPYQNERPEPDVSGI